MKKTATFILLTITLSLGLKAQDQPSKMLIADNLFERYEYFKSLHIYLNIAGRIRPRTHAVERVADCYRLMNDAEKAETWYKKAIDLKNALPIDHYYYAEMALRNNKFDVAREQYKQYYDAGGEVSDLKFKTATCDSAEKWTKAPSDKYQVNNEQKYNTKYSEWGVSYLGKTGLVFTSDRITSGKNAKIDNRNGDGFYRLYHSDGDIAIPFELKTKNSPVFDAEYHVGPMVFTNSGDTAYITVTTILPKGKIAVDPKAEGSKQRLYTRRLQLIIATKINGLWASFKAFAYNNLNEYSVGHAALSKRGDVIYFTSDMPGGLGGSDIWYCVKKSNGDWDTPVNCGKDINTKDDEAFPTLTDDGVLYYASNGLPGMGGFDIYEARGAKDKWGVPKNLKAPVNSTSDDLYLSTRDSLTGYFSSNRGGGKGNDDIYNFSYKPPVPVLKTLAKVSKPVIAKAPVPEPIPMSLKKGDTFVLRNIYYDLNKWNIRPDAAVELDKLVEILKEHPTLIIEMGSHTDSRAPSSYNMALSKRRADATVAYLVKRGIAPNRLVAHGYGDTRLLNECEKGTYCTEAQHQLNRRTEVKILSE